MLPDNSHCNIQYEYHIYNSSTVLHNLSGSCLNHLFQGAGFLFSVFKCVA